MICIIIFKLSASFNCHSHKWTVFYFVTTPKEFIHKISNPHLSPLVIRNRYYCVVIRISIVLRWLNIMIGYISRRKNKIIYNVRKVKETYTFEEITDKAIKQARIAKEI